MDHNAQHVAHAVADSVLEAAGPDDGVLILAGIAMLLESYPDRVQQLKDAIINIDEEAGDADERGKEAEKGGQETLRKLS